MRRINTQLQTIPLSATLLATVAWTVPASADFCLQFSGELSGALGFFRFKGNLPTSSGSITKLAGRVAGLSPVFGTATVTGTGPDKTVEIGATFFADASQGQFDVNLFPPFTTGSGYAGYGEYDVNHAVTLTVVSCSLEPS